MKTDEQIEKQQELDRVAKDAFRKYRKHRTTKNFQDWQRAHEAYLDSIIEQKG